MQMPRALCEVQLSVWRLFCSSLFYVERGHAISLGGLAHVRPAKLQTTSHTHAHTPFVWVQHRLIHCAHINTSSGGHWKVANPKTCPDALPAQAEQAGLNYNGNTIGTTRPLRVGLDRKWAVRSTLAMSQGLHHSFH